jgi:hypothetical protein
LAALTFGNSLEPLIYFQVPRALMIGLTIIRVQMFSAGESLAVFCAFAQ